MLHARSVVHVPRSSPLNPVTSAPDACPRQDSDTADHGDRPAGTLVAFPLSRHAARRARQRAIRPDAIEAALRWGHVYRQYDGRVAYFLGWRAVAAAARHGEDLTHLVRTAVVVAPDQTVVTVVRADSTRKLRARLRGNGSRHA